MKLKIKSEVNCPEAMYSAVSLDMCRACIWNEGIDGEYVECSKARTGNNEDEDLIQL